MIFLENHQMKESIPVIPYFMKYRPHDRLVSELNESPEIQWQTAKEFLQMHSKELILLVTKILAPELGGNWANWKMWTLLQEILLLRHRISIQNNCTHVLEEERVRLISETWNIKQRTVSIKNN